MFEIVSCFAIVNQTTETVAKNSMHLSKVAGHTAKRKLVQFAFPPLTRIAPLTGWRAVRERKGRREIGDNQRKKGSKRRIYPVA